MTMSDAFRLDGQVAVVTGAGKGIGRGIALCLAEAGADVVVSSRTLSDVQGVAAEIEKLGRRSLAVAADVTSAEQLETLVVAAKELGGLDIWVSNAGGLPDATPRYLTRTPEDRWDAQIDLNLKAVWQGAV
ncbi:MAG: SDR family NAD(P)-dependent oxidoreductase, partial [Pseudomonadales bacterium]|nr:SDR family NAD(P)-dependent oxidoreductase [Pseudomonadales bacterium]NIX06828.1 SDR family NAD(P)-dependent oxidoreductase [Pseudomonadales bacterium]